VTLEGVDWAGVTRRAEICLVDGTPAVTILDDAGSRIATLPKRG
jgi:hypothetical protein